MTDSFVLLVSGSRKWTDKKLIESRLSEMETAHPNLIVIEGHNPRGADRIAWLWATKARHRGVGIVPFPADWKTHHPGWCPGDWCRRRDYCIGAGPRRNQEMVDWTLPAAEKFLLAFKDNHDPTLRTGGTEDMIVRAKAAGIRCSLVHH